MNINFAVISPIGLIPKLILFSNPKTGKSTAVAALENNLIIDLESGLDFVDALKVNVIQISKEQNKSPLTVLKELINKIAEAEMNLCKKYNVKATIAVETGNVPDTPFITFFEEGQSYMYNELNSVYLNYKSNSSFNGFAIHYLDSWMNMKP